MRKESRLPQVCTLHSTLHDLQLNELLDVGFAALAGINHLPQSLAFALALSFFFSSAACIPAFDAMTCGFSSCGPFS